MTAVAPTPAHPARRSHRWLIAPILAFAAFSLAAGFLAGNTEPAGVYSTWYDWFFSTTVHMKAWLATAAAVLACFQLFTAAWIFRKYPIPKPRWVNPVHRASGVLAFLFTLPVAYHCIFKLGFESGDMRVAAHSFAGSAFFGAYAAKVTIIRLHRFPVWVLPTAGGLLFAALIAIWYSSAFWFFRTLGEGI